MRPALIVRFAVSLAALASFGAGIIAYTSGRVPAGPNLPLAGALLVLIAAMTRRYGIALPGNGFSSYVIGVMLFAILDPGWAFVAMVAPFAMLVGVVPPRSPSRGSDSCMRPFQSVRACFSLLRSRSRPRAACTCCALACGPTS